LGKESGFEVFAMATANDLPSLRVRSGVRILSGAPNLRRHAIFCASSVFRRRQARGTGNILVKLRDLFAPCRNNSTVVRGDIAAEVTKLKQEDGGDLLILGHGILGETLLKQRLIDVIDLTIYPVVIGHGRPFLRESQAVQLKLAATKSSSKIVKVTYEPQY
jgi:dihydrofolate reductase